jgi:hypothetical protein
MTRTSVVIVDAVGPASAEPAVTVTALTVRSLEGSLEDSLGSPR